MKQKLIQEKHISYETKLSEENKSVSCSYNQYIWYIQKPLE